MVSTLPLCCFHSPHSHMAYIVFQISPAFLRERDPTTQDPQVLGDQAFEAPRPAIVSRPIATPPADAPGNRLNTCAHTVHLGVRLLRSNGKIFCLARLPFGRSLASLSAPASSTHVGHGTRRRVAGRPTHVGHERTGGRGHMYCTRRGGGS
jgi:hypothetical protein